MPPAQGFLHIDGEEVFNNFRLWKALECRLGDRVKITLYDEPCHGLAIDLYGSFTPTPDGDGNARTGYNQHLRYNFTMFYNGGWGAIDFTDPPPWADDDNPAADEFLGFWVENFEFPISTATRTTYPLISGGSRLGRIRYLQREMPIEFLLVSTTDRGMWYGYDWLEGKINASAGCGGSTALIRQFCTPATRPLDGLWELHSVGLLDPIKDEGSPLKWDTAMIRSASMTLVAGDAFKHDSGLGGVGMFDEEGS